MTSKNLIILAGFSAVLISCWHPGNVLVFWTTQYTASPTRTTYDPSEWAYMFSSCSNVVIVIIICFDVFAAICASRERRAEQFPFSQPFYITKAHWPKCIYKLTASGPTTDSLINRFQIYSYKQIRDIKVSYVLLCIVCKIFFVVDIWCCCIVGRPLFKFYIKTKTGGTW